MHRVDLREGRHTPSGAVILLGLGAILASGWPAWGQVGAIGVPAAAVAAVRPVWVSQAPPPPRPESAPPLVRLIPRRREHVGLRSAR